MLTNELLRLLSFEKKNAREKHEWVFCCKRAHIATCQHSGWDWERKRWQQSNSFTFKKKSKLKKGSLVYKCRRLHAEMPSSYQAKMWKFKIISFLCYKCEFRLENYYCTIKIHEEKHGKLQFSIRAVAQHSFPLLNEPNFPHLKI